MKRHTRTLTALGCSLALAAFAVRADDEKKSEELKPIQPEQVNLGRPVDFERDVYPFLSASCVACHSSALPESKLSVETAEEILKGGKRGPAVVAKEPDKSLLFQLASHGKGPAMPPPENDVEAEPLTPKELGILRQWILEGAAGGMSSAARTVNWQPLPEGMNAIYSLALSPWGELAAVGRANRIAIYDIPGKRQIAQLTDPALLEIQQDGKPMYRPGTAHRDFVHALALNHDGTLLASGGYRVVKLWQRPANVRTANFIAPDDIADVDVSADGKWIAVAAGNTVTIYNSADGKPARTLEGHTAAVASVAFWPTAADKQKVDQASAAADTAVQNALYGLKSAQEATAVFDPKREKLDEQQAAERKQQLDAAVENAQKAVESAISNVKSAGEARETFDKQAAEQSRLVSASQDQSIRIWQVADGSPIGRIDTPAPVNDVITNLDAGQVISAHEDNLLRVWMTPSAASRKLTDGEFATLAVSPDKKWLALGAGDGKLVLIDLASGQTAKTLGGHQGAITSVRFSANSARLITGGADKTARVWDVASGQAVAVLTGVDAAVGAVALHPSGNQAVSGAADNSITLWKLDVAAPRALAGDNGNPVTVAAVSPDGKQLAVAGTADGKPAVIVRDIASGNITKTLVGHEGAMTALAFSADNAKILSGSADKTARVWNLADGKELAKFEGHTAAVTGVAFNSNAQQAVSGSADNSLKLWNVADAKELQNFAGHGGPISGVAMTANNQAVVSASADQTIRIWNPANAQQVRSISHGQPVSSLALSRDGNRIAATGNDNNVKLYQLSDGKLLATLTGHTAAAKTVAFSPDNARLVSTGADKQVMAWDVNGGTLLERFAAADKGVTFALFAGAANSLVVGTDDKAVAVHTLHYERTLAGHTKPITDVIYETNGNSVYSSSEDGTVRRFQCSDGRQLFSANHGAPVHDLDLSANGQLLASAGENNQIRVWNAANGGNAPKPTLAGFEAPVKSVCFSLDNTRLVGGAANNDVRVFDVAAGTEEQRFAEHTGAVQALSVAGEQGTQFISASADKTVRMWQLAAVKQLAGHSQPVTSVDLIRPAGTQIVSGSKDGTVRHWDLNNGNQIRSMNHGGPVTGVAARPDGQLVASSGANNVGKLWQVSNGQQRAELKDDLSIQRKVTGLTDDQTVAGQKVALAKAAFDAAEKNSKERDEALKKAQEAKTNADKAVPPAQEKAKKADEALAAAKAELAKKPDDAGLKKKVADAEKAANTEKENLKKATDAQAAAEKTVQRADEAVKKAKERLEQDKKSHEESVASQEKMKAELAEAQKLVGSTAKPLHAVAFSPDGKRLATAGDDQLLHLWDGETGQQLETLAGHAGAVTVLAYGTGDQLISAAADKQISVWDANAEWKLIGQLGPTGDDPMDTSTSKFIDRVVALDFSRDGKLLATGGGEPSRSGELMVWDVEKLSLVREFADAHSDTVFGVEFSRDGKLLLSGSADKFAKTHDVETGKHVRSFEGHTHHVMDVSWKADGATFASAGADNVVKVWNVETGEQRRTVNSGISKQVTSVRFYGTGEEFIMSDGNKQVAYYTANNGQRRRAYGGGTDFMYAADATRDLSLVVGGGEDGVFRVWNGQNGQSVATFDAPRPRLPVDGENVQASAAGAQ